MSKWKQNSRPSYEEALAKVREEQARKEAQRDRARQNALLRANGYTWHKELVSIPDALEYEDFSEEWVLRDSGGNAVTVAEALAVIAAK